MDVYDFLRRIFDDNYQRGRGSSSAIRISSNIPMEVRNGLYFDSRDRRRSTSIQQTYIYQFSTSSKRPSDEIGGDSQSTLRRLSKGILPVQES